MKTSAGKRKRLPHQNKLASSLQLMECVQGKVGQAFPPARGSQQKR